MTIDKARLKALAEAATPGPWECREAEGSAAICHKHGWVADDFNEQTVFDTRYMAAANPATVLALLAELEKNLMHLRVFAQVGDSLAAERDQLKVENATLRKDAELAAKKLRSTEICHPNAVEYLVDEAREALKAYLPDGWPEQNKESAQ
jgi:hypothetical protein